MTSIKPNYLILLAFALLANTYAKCQINPVVGSKYYVEHFGSDEGLPQNSVNSILPDANGFLWVATESGIARFNGNRFIPVTFKKGVTSGNFSRVKSFYIKSKDTIMAYAAAAHLVAFIVNNQIVGIDTQFFPKHGIFFSTLHQAIPTPSFLLHDFSNTPREHWDISQGMYNGGVYNKDTFLVIVNGGLAFYNSAGQINKIPIDSLSNKRMMYVKNKVLYVDNQNYVNFYNPSGLQQRQILPIPNPHNKAQVFNNSFGNNFFCVVDSVLYRIDVDANGQLQAQKILDDLQNADDITTVYQKDSNTIATGTLRNGLYIYKRQYFTVTDPVGKGESDIFYVQQLLNDNQTILTGNNKLFNNNKYLGKTKTVAISYPYSSLKDTKANYWYVYKNRVIVTKEIGVAVDTVLSFTGGPGIFFEDKAGRIWFSCTSKFGYFLDKKFIDVPLTNLKNPGLISYIEQDATGRYLLATREGLFILNDANARSVQEIPAFHSLDVRFVWPEANGQLWVCTYGHGFFLVQKDSVTSFTDGVSNLDYVHYIIEDSSGNFWMPTNNGLFVTTRQSLMLYVANKNSFPYYYEFSKKNGFRTNEFNGGTEPAYLRLPNGDISLATMQGLVSFNPAKVNFNFSSDPILIDNVRLDGIDVLQPINFEVASNVNNIRFTISNSFWGDGVNDMLQYRVVEKGTALTAEGQWLYIDASGKVNLFSPSYGKYELQVRKRKGLQPGDYVYKTTDFTVLPKWYQTRLFFICRAILFALLLTGIFFWRRNYYRRSNRILKEKVDAATKELQESNSTLEKKVIERTEAIQEAEKKFRTLVEGSLAGVYIIQDDVYTYVNPRFEEILGYTSGELLGTSPLAIIAARQRDFVSEKKRRRMAGEVESDHYETIALKKDGTERQMEFFGSRTIYEGKPTIIGTMLDITERKQMEVELIEAELKFRDLVEKSLVGVYIIQEGKFAYVNPRFAEMFGYTQQELTNADSVNIVVCESDREKVAKNIALRISNEIEGIHYEVKCMKKDGTPVDTELFGRATQYEGSPAIIGTLLDITARKRAEDQLINEKDLSQSIINSLPGVFFIFDEHRVHQLWNKNYEIVTGYSGAELKGKLAGECIQESDMAIFTKAVEKMYANGSAEVEVMLINKQKRKIPFYVNGIAITYDGKPCILGIGIDISERKKAEYERERANYLLNERIKELTTLYRAGVILQSEGRSIIVTLQDFVSAIPSGYQYSQITGACITLGEMQFSTANFAPSPYAQTSTFTTNSGTPGKIEVVYLQETPTEDEGPFLKEERALIDMLADMLKTYFIRREATDALQKSEANMNTIFANTDTVYVLLDTNFDIITYNQRAAQFAKNELDKNILPHTNFISYFPQDRQPALQDNVNMVLQGKLVSYETSYLQPDGTNNWYYVRMFPILDAHKMVFGMMMVVSDITEKKLLEEEVLNQKIQEQKMMTRAIILGEERERNKIGQELHDNISQILAGTKLYLGMARQNKTGGEGIINESMGLLDSAIEEIRALSKGKVTPMKKVNLHELLQTLIDRFNETTGIKTNFIYNGAGQTIEDDLKLNIYRIMQEQLNNVYKHSKASVVSILVAVSENNIRVSVADDGEGFVTDDKKDGIGLSNIINRVASFNGTIDIDSSPGNGCKIDINLPY